MNYLKILSDEEKKKIERQLDAQFGIKQIHGLIIQRGEERLFLYQGSLSKEDIKKLDYSVPIERIGIYFAKIIHDDLKLSIEGTQILKDQITKNIFVLNEEEAEEWMTGTDLQIKTGKRGFIVMKYENDFLGCGKASDEKIGNYIPKSLRLRQKIS